MVLYKCDRCEKEFKYKNDFRRHINRKNPCIKMNHNESFLNHEKSYLLSRPDCWAY